MLDIEALRGVVVAGAGSIYLFFAI